MKLSLNDLSDRSLAYVDDYVAIVGTPLPSNIPPEANNDEYSFKALIESNFKIYSNIASKV